MYIQTEKTPNPNSLKFIPGKKVSLVGPIEVLDKIFASKSSNTLFAKFEEFTLISAPIFQVGCLITDEIL